MFLPELELGKQLPGSQKANPIEMLALLYPSFSHWANRYLLGVTYDAAVRSDLIQDVFLKAIEQQHCFAGRTVDEVRAWLRTTLRRDVLHFLRTQARTRRRETCLCRSPMLPIAFFFPCEPLDPLEVADLEEMQLLLYQAIGKLPNVPRRVIKLCFLKGYSHADAAAKLNRPQDTIRKIKARAIHALRRELTKRSTAATDSFDL